MPGHIQISNTSYEIFLDPKVKITPKLSQIQNSELN